MIDNITVVTSFEKPLDFSRLGNIMRLGNIDLVAQRCLRNFQVNKYQARIQNLLFTVTPEQLKISNSIHKFFCGSNYTNYTFNDLVNTIKKIEQMTQIPAQNFDVKKVELALNISMDLEAVDYLEYFLDYKNVFPINMMTGRIIYGKSYNLTEYRIKIYSKSHEVKKTTGLLISPNILRVEIQFLQGRVLKGKYTLRDLMLSNKVTEIFDIYFDILSKIKLKGYEDFSKIEIRDHELYYAGQNPKYWKTKKASNINIAKERRKDYAILVKKVNQENTIDFTALLKQQFAALN